LTLWTASYCSSCRTIKPLLQSFVESGIGETEGGVNYCEVEFDAPDVLDSGLGMTYMVNSLPSLITFDRGEVVDRITDVGLMKDKLWLKEYIEKQATRRGQGTSSPSSDSGSGFFGGLFGNTKR
jgi:thiol-disulfide isomerase/thioredoxin